MVADLSATDYGGREGVHALKYSNDRSGRKIGMKIQYGWRPIGTELAGEASVRAGGL